MSEINVIQSKIYEIRGMRVMLDFDLAELYQVETRVLNQSVKRNIKRFPPDFMFQLNVEEFSLLKSQFVTSRWGGTRKLPYAFTEQGIAMLSGLLRNQIAVKVSINIMDAFVEMRKFLSSNSEMFNRLINVEYKLLEHDTLRFVPSIPNAELEVFPPTYKLLDNLRELPSIYPSLLISIPGK